VLALAACGPEDLGSPGVNGDVNIGDIIDNSVNNSNNTNNTGGGTGGSTGGGLVEAADNCPTSGTTDVFTNQGTVSGPTGTYRICSLPSVFLGTDPTIPFAPGVIYRMDGRVNVGVDDGPLADASDGVTGTPVDLSIEPGVIVYADEDSRAWLAVNRGSTLRARGTATRPIVFTAYDNVIGVADNETQGEWGGIVLMGRAPVSDCNTGNPNPNKAQCEMQVEGALQEALFGGPDAADSSGSLQYVQIRYSGVVLSQNKELQSLTTGGIGSGTVLENIMSFNSSDDGAEFFGGSVNMEEFVAIGASDDSLDIDTGAKFNLRRALVVQRTSTADHVLEVDSEDGDFTTAALPRTQVNISNFTFVHQDDGEPQAVLIRGTADVQLANGIITTEGDAANRIACFGIDEETGATTGDDESGPPKFDSLLLDCDVDAGNARGGAAFLATNNVVGYMPTLTGNGAQFINGATEDNATTFDATQLSSFFANLGNLGYVGAVASTDTWYQNWTCNSDTVNLAGDSSCYALPVYN